MRVSALSTVLVVLGFLGSGMVADTASAQLLPFDLYDYYYNGPFYFGWGGYPYGVYSQYDTLSRLASDRRAQAEARAMAQNQAVQQDIRSLLASGAQARNQTVPGQQSTRDWWFEHQVQAAQRSRPPFQPAAAAPGTTPNEFSPSAVQPPKPDQFGEAMTWPRIVGRSAGIIKWPQVLEDPQFAAQRARVEAPYRNRTTAGRPTVKDYQQMIDAAAQMKTILKGMAPAITPIQYQEAANFLDILAAEAHTRAEQKAAAGLPAEPAKRPAAPASQGA
jgi:hypothetical protein